MSGVAKKLMGTTKAGGGFTAIEDVFSTYLYTGGSTTLNIDLGIDLAAEDGLTWIKCRNAAEDHFLFSSLQNGSSQTLFLETNTTGAAVAINNVSQTSTGFSIPGGDGQINQTGNTYASWTFRKAPRFFDVVTYTGTGADNTIAHSIGAEVGCIIIKRTDSTGDWWVYHKSTPNFSLKLNSTAAQVNQGGLDATETTFTLYDNANVNISGATYVAYLFAHDPLGPSGDGSDGLIDCGSYTGGGSSQVTVDLGFEPQWLMIKRTDSSDNWHIFDTMRNFADGQPRNNSLVLLANSSSSENDIWINLTNSGFKLTDNQFFSLNASGGTYIYIAIRRGPMRAPESGTEVFAPAQYDGTKFPTGFPVDFAIAGNAAGTDKWYFQSRLQGPVLLSSASTAAEVGSGSAKFDLMDGYGTGFSTAYYSTAFRRAPEFFDVVAYTGTGSVRTVAHNLGVAPEMILFKKRSNFDSWPVYLQSVGNTAVAMFLNETFGAPVSTNIAWFNNTSPTASEITLGSGGAVNESGQTFIAYLFSTLAGISKVGSYTGNGTSQTINCGFTTGARFVLIKRTDTNGDWYVWDTARGIVAANDPHLSLNTTAAEVTTDDSVDPDSSGFIVNQVAATNINVSAASYIFYAVS